MMVSCECCWQVASLIPGSIEVVPRTLNKSLLLKHLLAQITSLRAGRLPSFIAVFGADDQDSSLFTAAYDMLTQAAPQAGPLSQCRLWTVAVGRAEAAAKYIVQDVSEVEALLRGMTEGSGANKK